MVSDLCILNMLLAFLCFVGCVLSSSFQNVIHPSLFQHAAFSHTSVIKAVVSIICLDNESRVPYGWEEDRICK